MKKLIAKIVTVILSATFVLSMFAGCNWVTTIRDKDMDQVVATVNISTNTKDADLKNKLNDDKIYKRDLIAGYMSYGYQYVTQNGYTESRAYQIVLDNIISNKVVTELARYELSKTIQGINLKFDENPANTGLNADYAKHLKAYLSDYEYANAIYMVRSSVNSMVDTFEEEDEEDDEKEDVTYTPRTTPTKEQDQDTDEEALKARKATSYEIQVAEAVLDYDEAETVPQAFTDLVSQEGGPSAYDLNMYVYQNYKIDFDSSRARKQGASKLFDYLETNGLNKEGYKWASDENGRKSEKERYFDVNDPEKSLNCTYFQSLIISRLESALITKYENSLVKGIEESELSTDGLWQQYLVEYATQEALYRNDVTSYETALSNASDTSFVLYTPYENAYGYVTNLLIGFSEEQTALLKDYSSKKGITEADVIAYRKGLLESLQASDQRTTWVQSNYGTYTEEAADEAADQAAAKGVFTFGEDYRVSSLESVKNFIGTVKATDKEGTLVEDSNGVKKGSWTYTEVTPTKIGFADFYNTYVKELLGEACYFENGEAFGQATYTDELYDKFCDLLFAFSTDPGCLNKEYGYLYSDFTSATTYVKEFAEASKLVVSKGPGAYTIVATEYGYHIIMCTKIVETPYTTDDAGKTAFTADLENKDTLAYKYREVKKNAVVSTKISKFVETKINPYVDDENTDGQYAVTLYKKAYKDLISEEEEAE